MANTKYRRPDYIHDQSAFTLLMEMSKADLAELVFDYAIRTVGESESIENPKLITTEIIETSNAVRLATGRKEIKP